MGRVGRAVRWTVVAAASVLIAGLTGCGDDAPSPAPLEPLSSSAAPTEPSASPAPTLPAEAQAVSLKSAKRFAAYLIDVINYATATGDVSELRAVSMPRCQTCRAIIRNVTRIYSKGGQFYGKGVELQLVTSNVKRPADRPILDLGTYFNDEVVRIPGEDPQRRRGAKQPLTLYLRWVDGGWRVQRLDVVQ